MVLRHSVMLVAIVSIFYVFLSSGVPTVDAQGLSVTINEGDTINGVINTNTTVTCSTSGATNVTWLAPNGFTINPALAASKYSINFNSITGTSTLIIISVQTTDNGFYTCRAANSLGQSMNDSIQLTAVTAVLYDPLTVQSDTLYAIEGDNYTLVCIASSMYAEAEVYWTVDAQRLITSCTSSVLFGNQYTKVCLYTRTNVQRSDDSKVFNCLASVPGTDRRKTWTLSVKVRPTNPAITQTSATVQVGSTASWSCTTSGGNPTPTLIWQLDLTQITNGGSYNIPASFVTEQTVNGYTTYTVTSTISWSLTSQDIGKLLYCKVTSVPAPLNTVASLVISTSATVTLTVEILNGDSVSATEGQSITLTCRVVGAGSISVTWFGPKVLSGSKYTIIPYSFNSSQSTLTISNLDSTDSGTYICLARSGASSSDFQDSVTLAVTAPLSVDITNGLTVTGTPGQSITLTCRVTGSGTIIVNWIGLTGAQLFTNFKYTVVAYDTNSRQTNLTINSLTTSDAGTYTCRGSDSSGARLQDTVQLTVAAPLSVRITNGPTVTATEGLSVTVTCEVTGSGTISVIWFGPTGGQLFTNFKYNVGAYNSNTRQSTLTINSGTTSDAGTYKCRGSDSSGSQEDSTQLTFTVPLSVSIDNGNSITGVNGGSITITCSVSGTGTITVTWVDPLQNIISSGSKYTISSYNYNTRKASLTIQSLSINDVGNYICRANDSSGTQIEKSIYVTTAILTAVINEATVFANVGDNTIINCTVTGSYQSINWYRENTLVSNGQKFQISQSTSGGITQSSLTIFNVQYNDATIYACMAVSSIDGTTTVSDTVNLSVGARPLVTIGLTTLSGFSGQDIRVNCTVTSTESVTVTWYGNNTVLANAVTSPGSRFSWQNSLVPSLTISRAVVSDTGMYRCQAQNNYGTGSDTVQLTVEVNPALCKYDRFTVPQISLK